VNNKLTAKQRSHMGRIKLMACSVCDATGPSDAHHIEQSLQYCVIPLCKDCHQGSFNGLHGQKRAWILRKMSELDALNKTIQRLVEPD